MIERIVAKHIDRVRQDIKEFKQDLDTKVGYFPVFACFSLALMLHIHASLYPPYRSLLRLSGLRRPKERGRESRDLPVCCKYSAAMTFMSG